MRFLVLYKNHFFKMTTLKKTILIAASILIIMQLVLFDYNDFSWATNSGTYVSIIAMILVIVSMLASPKKEAEQTKS